MNKTNEIVFEKGTLKQRFFAYIFDTILFVFLSSVLFSVLNGIYLRTDFYQNQNDIELNLKNQSGLYIDNELITDYVEESDNFETYEEKKNFLCAAINNFYTNSEILDQETREKATNLFLERKSNAYNGEVKLFINDGENINENSVNPSFLYDFYKEEIEEQALYYLTSSDVYFDITKTKFLISIAEIVLSTITVYSILYLLIPCVLFKRGRQTFGMKIIKLSLVNKSGMNISLGRYLFRSVFNYFVFIPLNFVSFLIPTFISIGMTIFNNANSSLTNYIFNDYFVDSTNKTVYLSSEEKFLESEKIQNSTLENDNFISK